MEQVKCPECGGTKCTALNNETYRCQYCGATIKVKSEAEVQQTTDNVVQPTATGRSASTSTTAASSATIYTTTRTATGGNKKGQREMDVCFNIFLYFLWNISLGHWTN